MKILRYIIGLLFYPLAILMGLMAILMFSILVIIDFITGDDMDYPVEKQMLCGTFLLPVVLYKKIFKDSK